MYSQEGQQNDAQTSNTRKQGEETNLQLNPQLETVCARERSLAKVFKNKRGKVNLAGDAPTLGIQAHKTNLLIWCMFMSASMKAAIHVGPDFTEILEVYKNTNIEELQSLFDITQKLVHKRGEILNVKMIECASPSWTRSSLAHDQGKSTVLFRFSLMLGKISDHSDANRRWEGQVEEFRQSNFPENYLELMEN